MIGGGVCPGCPEFGAMFWKCSESEHPETGGRSADAPRAGRRAPIGSAAMDWQNRLRWGFVALIGVVLAAGGASSAGNGFGAFHIGVGLIFLAALGAWWHSDLLRQKREAAKDKGTP